MAEHFCQEHGVAFGKHTKGDKIWYSHKLGDNSWCNEHDKVIRTPQDLPGPKAEPPVVIPKEPNIRENMEWKQQNIEVAFWWNQLGECLRSGFIDVSKPQGLQLKMAYLAEMFRVLNIKPTKTEPKP